jgi:predicted lipid-binding transport protein (Tim44 family)
MSTWRAKGVVRRWLQRALVLLCLGTVSLAPVAESFARPGGGSSYRGGSSRSGGSWSGGSRSGGSSSSSRSGGSSSRSSDWGGSRSSGTGDYGSRSSGTPIWVGSGSSSPSSGSSSSGGSALLGFIILLVILIAAVVFIWFLYRLLFPAKPQQWSTSEALSVEPRAELERLRTIDPAFSLVVFEDFISALYPTVLRAHAQGQLATLSPYVAPGAQSRLAERNLGGLGAVIIGGMTIDEVEGIPVAGEPSGQFVQVTLVIEANLGSRDPSTGREHGLYVMEKWTLSRSLRARSRTPDRARSLGCPNCGAPLQQVFGGRCNHCGQNVLSGAFDWTLTNAIVCSEETVGPILGGHAEEQGTDLMTIVDPYAHSRLAALKQRDPSFDWNQFSGRIDLVFREFQQAWAGRDLSKMRPFMSDTLFSVQSYWVNEYLAQRLRNVTEQGQIERIDIARVTEDAFFDAIIVRLFASSTDYTVSDDGQLVSGSRTARRRYSEYWTLIRGRGVNKPTKTTPECPRCGAPLKITMAGDCTYCNARVTSGAFDWVLSRIEQDEAYVG